MTHPQDEPIGTLETVHSFDDGPMPTGVSVSATGRVFVNFPKWGDDVRFTVAERVATGLTLTAVGLQPVAAEMLAAADRIAGEVRRGAGSAG